MTYTRISETQFDYTKNLSADFQNDIIVSKSLNTFSVRKSRIPAQIDNNRAVKRMDGET